MKRIRAAGWMLMLMVVLVGLAASAGPRPAFAQDDNPVCRNIDGGVTCETGGRLCTQDCGEDAIGASQQTCKPGENFVEKEVMKLFTYGDNRQGCLSGIAKVDACTGAVHGEGYFDTFVIGEAEMCFNQSAQATLLPVCDKISYIGGRLVCDSSCFGFNISASVAFPGFCIDVTPYPVTLVNYDTAVRNSCMGTASGSGTEDYFGRGSPSNPREGDMRNIRLTLTFRPYNGNAYVWLPKLPLIILPPASDNSMPFIFRWQQASHPDAGAKTLAGSVRGLEEAPADMPVYEGYAAAPYRLFWQLTYEQYRIRTERECVDGSIYDRTRGGWYKECNQQWNSDDDNLVKDGIWREREIKEWVGRSRGGEIYPWTIKGLPPNLAADLNGDGLAEAFWNWAGLNLRRMTEDYRIEQPLKTYNFGGRIYWGVREGQGQIGYPGVSP